MTALPPDPITKGMKLVVEGRPVEAAPLFAAVLAKDPDHPAALWLKYQSFVTGRELPDAQAVSARLPALLEADFRLMVPLVRWINAALGLKETGRL